PTTPPQTVPPSDSHARCNLFLQLAADPRPPHSFPTRRSSDLLHARHQRLTGPLPALRRPHHHLLHLGAMPAVGARLQRQLRAKGDRKSTRLNSSHASISYAVFCLKKKKTTPPCLRMTFLFDRT